MFFLFTRFFLTNYRSALFTIKPTHGLQSTGWKVSVSVYGAQKRAWARIKRGKNIHMRARTAKPNICAFEFK